MEEWKTYKLGDIASVQTGPFGSQLHNEDYVSVGTPIVTVEHLGARKFSKQNLPRVSKEDKERLSKYSLQEGDIVFSRVGSVDRCSYVSHDEDGWLFSGRCLRVRSGNLVCPLFLYYYFQKESVKQEIRNVAVGATMPSINTKLLSDLTVILPPITEQKRIAGILSYIDDKIELNNRINHNLEEQAQALYKSWFVEFEPFRDGKFIDSEFGLIPDGWHIGNISEMISDTYNGDWGKEESTGAFTKRVFCIRGADIPSIRVGSSGKMPTRFIQEKHFLSKYLKNDDLVIEISGGSPTQSTGRFCRITSDLIERYDHSLICTNFCKAIRPIEGCSLFLSYLWNDLYEKGTMFSYENGTTGIKNLDLSGLIMGEPVIIPDKRSMQLFSYAVSALNKQILFNGHENEKLGEQRDLMLPKLMSGEMISNNDVC